MSSRFDKDMALARIAHRTIFAPFYVKNGFKYLEVPHVEGHLLGEMQERGIDTIVWRDNKRPNTVDEKAVRGVFDAIFVEQCPSTSRPDGVLNPGYLYKCEADRLLYLMIGEAVSKLRIYRWAGSDGMQKHIQLEIAKGRDRLPDIGRWKWCISKAVSRSTGWVIPTTDIADYQIGATIEIPTPGEMWDAARAAG